MTGHNVPEEDEVRALFHATYGDAPVFVPPEHEVLGRQHGGAAWGVRRRTAVAAAVLLFPAALVTLFFAARSERKAGANPQPVRQSPAAPTGPAGAVPWLMRPPARLADVPPPKPKPAPPLAIPPGTPACRAAQLDGAVLSQSTSDRVQLGIRNRGPSDCVIEGFPDVSIVGGAGRVLAFRQGIGTEGSYFDLAPQAPVLMLAGTPLLPGGDPVSAATRKGQAYVELYWMDCQRRAATGVRLTLLNGGGQFFVPYAGLGDRAPACDGGPPGRYPQSNLGRGPFSPAGFTWPPEVNALDIHLSGSVPGTVRRGTTLVFYVKIESRGTNPYVLDRCPDYHEFAGPQKEALGIFQLNCAPGSIAPGRTVAFEMRLDIPATAAAGPTQLVWYLHDGRVKSDGLAFRIEITP